MGVLDSHFGCSLLLLVLPPSSFFLTITCGLSSVIAGPFYSLPSVSWRAGSCIVLLSLVLPSPLSLIGGLLVYPA